MSPCRHAGAADNYNWCGAVGYENVLPKAPTDFGFGDFQICYGMDVKMLLPRRLMARKDWRQEDLAYCATTCQDISVFQL